MPAETPKKILIIEDEKELVFGLTTLLKAHGYAVIAAYDSLFGISMAHKEKPDLVILDLGLPAGGGLYVLKNLKNSVETLGIPVVVLTAQAGADLEKTVKELGGAAFLQKPFDPQTLPGRIRTILEPL
jgi:two-component system alkaline phosphatase synthesis response regulator PhoP